MDKYPIGVVSEKDYDKYLVYKNKMDTSKDRYFKTSDPNLILDLCTSKGNLRKKSTHLPSDEIDRIFEGSNTWRSHIGTMATFKRRAFGNINPGRGGDGSTVGLGPAAIKKDEILGYFGRYFKPGEVHKICTMEWGYDITLTSLQTYYKANIDKIEELKDEFDLQYSDVRLGHKRSRLDELTFLYNKIKAKYEQDEYREDAKMLQGLLESIKKEVEGDLVINGKLKVDVEQTVNLQVQHEMLKDFNITALIISRLSAKLQVNSVYILNRLASSRYAKFSGFGTPDISREKDQVPYTSDVIYDMDKLPLLNKEIEEEKQPLKILPPISNDEQKASDIIKKKLLDSLRKNQNGSGQSNGKAK